MHKQSEDTYWRIIWRQFYKHKLGRWALWVVILFCLVGVYAPFFASSKPLIVQYQGEWYFALFRYLFYRQFYTKGLDIFFNLMIFTLPLVLLVIVHLPKYKKTALAVLALVQIFLFIFFIYGPSKDPSYDASLRKQRELALPSHPLPSWAFDLQFMSSYAKLNLVLHYRQILQQQAHLQKFLPQGKTFPTLWQDFHDQEEEVLKRNTDIMAKNPPDSIRYKEARASADYVIDRRRWLQEQLPEIKYAIMPFVRPFHWEDDAGGSQLMNSYLPFWDLTRTNRKDLVAALIFGVRISLIVGLLAVSLALIIGLPIGALAGFYGGNFDIVVSRLLEIWEAMPTFFMLLMAVAILQSKSIFLVIAIIGIFGWTSFSRYLRGEFFKQRNLPYIEACRALGYRDPHIMFSHILPNAIPPVLTLLPFAIMGAISSEAGLSFLGLGEEGSCSWGVIMDEGRTAFPSESYLLWPPGILLTTLLVAIALVGDSLRDALDPKLHR